MAERSEKIYPALPQRRKRAREEGQIARSHDLTGAASFLAATLMVSAAGAVLGRRILSAFRYAMSPAASHDLGTAVRRSMVGPLETFALVAGALAVAAVVGAVAQDGLVFSPARLAPKLERLNPGRYFERMFSAATFLEVAKAAVKIVLIAIIAWTLARQAQDRYAQNVLLSAGPPVLLDAIRRLLQWSAVIALTVGIADYLHKRYRHESELKMTRQEFLDELKQEEGNPQVKRALRAAQRKSFKRMRGMHQAASASVVVTNPTHLAVALRYRRGFDQAPLVVAKGAGDRARRIVIIARLAAVPVIEDRPLARVLFRIVEVGDHIPRQFYRAVAEVLALVMRSRAASGVSRTP